MRLSRSVGFSWPSSSLERSSWRREEMKASSFEMTYDFKSSYGVSLVQAAVTAPDTWERIL